MDLVIEQPSQVLHAVTHRVRPTVRVAIKSWTAGMVWIRGTPLNEGCLVHLHAALLKHSWCIRK